MILLSLQWWQLALIFLPALLNLWGIWHSLNHEFANPSERFLWVGLCIFLPFLGGLVYLVFGRRRALLKK